MRHCGPFLACLVLAAALAACKAANPDASPETPARALLERSLRYHDPEGVWGREPVSFHWTSTRPNGETSFDVDLRLDPDGTFALQGVRRGHDLEYRVADGVATFRVDGEAGVPAELGEELVLARDGGLFWRDYLGFLGGLPMCLAEPSVRLEPQVESVEVEGLDPAEVQALRASFAPEVGTDIWTFYFDPETGALVGCRFDRADPTKDGETIVFEGTVVVDQLRLPRTRRWYMNADRRFLGTDELAQAVNAAR